MPGQLLTHYFLTDGIKATPEWKDLAPAIATFREKALSTYENFKEYRAPNESVTEQDLVRPILETLGWHDYLPQQGTQRNEDIPDHLLFSDAESKARAVKRNNSQERFLDTLLIEESKRFRFPLDSRDQSDKVQTGTPHGQILRYLSTADTATDGRIRWGILTNGCVWRLYDHRTRPRATSYFETNLEEALEPGNEDTLRIFYLLLHRDSFIQKQGATTSFIEVALAEGRRYEESVAQDLSGTVFDSVFPRLIEALANATGKELPQVRETALTFLYRLLFILYAEDRGLLPVNDARYDDYGLRKRGRDDIAKRTEQGDIFSEVATTYYDHLTTLFRIIDKGDESIGIPPYNGGLFAEEATPLLAGVRLPDKVISSIIYDLSHTKTAQGRHFVNYRDMSVQQLGSIYENLLEQEPVRTNQGQIIIRPNSYARKDSGSFFTPQKLVDLIVEHTLKPLAEERLTAFETKAKELEEDSRPTAERQAELLKLDPAEAVLDLKVLDPAMGSGHFLNQCQGEMRISGKPVGGPEPLSKYSGRASPWCLSQSPAPNKCRFHLGFSLVTAVDFLSDYIADLIEYTPNVPEWLNDRYASPLINRIAAIRQDIIQRARESNWSLDQAQLTDQTIIRRMVLKRCIYGADKNPLTVELAKVALWLHSFTVGAPLSFLDHHLRCGDSLVGLRVLEATKELNRLGGLFASSAIAGAEAATTGMHRIEEMSDADISEVRESASLFQEVENTTSDLRNMLDLLTGIRWLTAGLKAKERTVFESPLVNTLGQQPSQSYDLLAKGPDFRQPETTDNQDESWTAFQQMWNDAKSIAERESFLHWEVAFPGVWTGWQNDQPQGGFDAVIGNPPWDRIKLQEVEWFATRSPELALAATAAARKTGIQQLRNAGAPLVDEFDTARDQAEKLGQLIRSYGQYPLLAGGDINLYSLFVERAMSLVNPGGMVGLLTPSGIYADKTAAPFFKSISTEGRIAGLFDFENRRLGTDLPPFFPDVDSRFKFCALVFGGEQRRFPETQCAFFLQDPETVADPDRCFPLAPADFARVNPNTGTAPIFRTRRDAEITRRIYENHPVLVDRSQGAEHRAWPVRYNRMFDMTNDSHLFRTAAQLEAEGCYPVDGNRWKKGQDFYLPLYEGKMVQAYDHRAASVFVNPANLNRPAQPRESTEEEHKDPNWLPRPQFWVGSDSVQWPDRSDWTLSIKHISSSTNVRTIIAALAPRAGFGNSLPVFFQIESENTPMLLLRGDSCLLLGNLNAFALDFVARQKLQGQNLNLFILEQLPIVAPDAYDRQFGVTTAKELVLDHVLRLTYTANDMVPFAKDLGYDGPPFLWDEEERRHLRARLDALYFHLYGLSRDDADYILSTFPIVQKEDEAQFGRYRTRDLILAYMSALDAGDTNTVVAM